MSTVQLQSSDGRIFNVDIEVAKKFGIIKTLLESFGIDDKDEILPIKNVEADILQKVIEWAEHHVGDDVSEEGPITGDEWKYSCSIESMTEWDKEFIEVGMDVLFKLIKAANYLDINGLLELSCKAVASRIKHKDPMEMRKIFSLSPRSNEIAAKK